MISNENRISKANLQEWLALKFTFIAFVNFYFFYCLNAFNSQPFPEGICRYFNCAIITVKPIIYVVEISCSILTVLYISEKLMLLSTFGLFLLSMVILSMEKSNGLSVENGIISLVLFVQFCAYFFHKIDSKCRLETNRISYSIQIVAALYFLAALSKLKASGLNWFLDDSPKLALEVLKIYQMKFAATGVLKFKDIGIYKATFLINHSTQIRILLFIVLAIEFFSFLMLLGKKWAFYYGFLLVLLHIGIYVVLDITFPTIMIPMILIVINPLYVVWLLYDKYLFFEKWK